MNPAFRFARSGKVYKELEADEAHLIPGFLRTGAIAPDDDYWTPGMTEWKKVSSRDWVVPKSAPTPSTPAVPPAPSAQLTQAVAAAEAAQAQAAATTSATAGRSHPCECTACKKGFASPAKAISGYSVIGQAAKYFACGIVLMVLSYALMGPLIAWSNHSELQGSYVIPYFVVGLLYLAALCFFLMTTFELIAAAVTHGIYRANPDRCPYCNSPTFTRKI